MKMNRTNFLLMLLLVVFMFAVVVTFAPSKPKDNYTQELSQIQTVSTSDEVDDIEKDIDATDMESVDKELTELDNLLY